jgi:hypothetical protein
MPVGLACCKGLSIWTHGQPIKACMLISTSPMREPYTWWSCRAEGRGRLLDAHTIEITSPSGEKRT